MSDAAVSRVEIMPAFEAAVINDQARESLLAALAVGNRNDVSSLVRSEPVTPLSLHNMFVAIEEQTSGEIGKIIGVGGPLGTRSDLQATVAQSDYCCRAKRAASLRHCSFVRRTVHAAARRESHGAAKGYLDRRVKDQIVNTLLAGKNDERN